MKPYSVAQVLTEATPVTIKAMEEALGDMGPSTRVIRCMPNTPCLVGEAAVAFARGSATLEGDRSLTKALFTGTVR